MKGGCLDCGVPVSKPRVYRCRKCNGRRMRERHRKMRALRAGVLSVNAKAVRRLVKRMAVRFEHVAGQRG
jgi:tRNA(Ile2) C34 agmatinyltransferase TiaS